MKGAILVKRTISIKGAGSDATAVQADERQASISHKLCTIY